MLMPPSLLMINVYVLNVSQSAQVTMIVYANMCFRTLYIFGKQSIFGGKKFSHIKYTKLPKEFHSATQKWNVLLYPINIFIYKF